MKSLNKISDNEIADQLEIRRFKLRDTPKVYITARKILENEIKILKEKLMKYSEGDRVQVVSGLFKDSYGTITKNSIRDNIEVKLDHDKEYFLSTEQLAPMPTFKVGDQVRVIRNHAGWLSKDDVGEVCGIGDNGFVFVASGNSNYGIHSNNLELLNEQTIFKVDNGLGSELTVRCVNGRFVSKLVDGQDWCFSQAFPEVVKCIVQKNREITPLTLVFSDKEYDVRSAKRLDLTRAQLDIISAAQRLGFTKLWFEGNSISKSEGGDGTDLVEASTLRVGDQIIMDKDWNSGTLGIKAGAIGKIVKLPNMVEFTFDKITYTNTIKLSNFHKHA
jgi:hypothetical protein